MGEQNEDATGSSAPGNNGSSASLRSAVNRFGLAGLESLSGDADPPAMVIADCPERGRRLVLKEKRSYLSDSEFCMHVALHRHVFEAGGPVTQPLAWDDRDVLTDCDGALAETYEHAVGTVLDPESISHLHAAGATLARFHIVAAGFTPQVEHAEPRERFAKAVFYRQFLDALSVPASTVDELYRLLGQAEIEARQLSPCEVGSQIVHGDPAPSNLLIGDDHSAILIDLDDAHESVPVSDLAWLLSTTAALRWQPAGEPEFRLLQQWDMEAFNAVLEGYRAVGGPSTPTVDVLRPWLCASLVCAVTDCFVEAGEAPPDTTPGLPRLCTTALHLIESMNHWAIE